MAKRFQHWARWKGYFPDLVEAAQVAVASIEKWSGNPPEGEIEVTFPGHVRSFGSPQELESQVDVRDVSRITSARIRIGPRIEQLRASIRVEQDSPAVSLEVSGDDEDQVKAVFDNIAVPLERGQTRLNFGRLGSSRCNLYLDHAVSCHHAASNGTSHCGRGNCSC